MNPVSQKGRRKLLFEQGQARRMAELEGENAALVLSEDFYSFRITKGKATIISVCLVFI